MAQLNLRDFPESFETERLLLRAPLPGDGVVVNAAIRESADDLRTWMEWLGDTLPSVEETEERCLNGRQAFLERSEFGFYLFLKGTNTFVGKCSLHVTDWAVPSFMIGYWVNKPFEGQGYITEAVQAITDIAFGTLGANRVWLSCEPRNLRSRRVAERAGFILEAELRNERRMPDGRLRDTLIYSMVSEEWKALTTGHD